MILFKLMLANGLRLNSIELRLSVQGGCLISLLGSHIESRHCYSREAVLPVQNANQQT